GDGDLSYAVNAVSSMGARVEVIGLQTTTSDYLIDVADEFTDFDSIKQYLKKDSCVSFSYRTSSNYQY
ncbi:MAG: NYN domain-containing protein, partial [Dolichospermum sp.]